MDKEINIKVKEQEMYASGHNKLTVWLTPAAWHALDHTMRRSNAQMTDVVNQALLTFYASGRTAVTEQQPAPNGWADAYREVMESVWQITEPGGPEQPDSAVMALVAFAAEIRQGIAAGHIRATSGITEPSPHDAAERPGCHVCGVNTHAFGDHGVAGTVCCDQSPHATKEDFAAAHPPVSGDDRGERWGPQA